MAVQLLSKSDSAIYVGLSSDTKPTAPTILSKFLEVDTKLWYLWDGSAWVLDGGLPVSIATRPGEDATNNVVVVEQGQYDYEAVAAGQTDQVMGVTGGVGDLLHKVIVQVATSGATGIVSIKDGGGSSIPLVPASTPVGVYPIEINISSVSGAWKVTTGAGATALVAGRFTA